MRVFLPGLSKKLHKSEWAGLCLQRCSILLNYTSLDVCVHLCVSVYVCAFWSFFLQPPLPLHVRNRPDKSRPPIHAHTNTHTHTQTIANTHTSLWERREISLVLSNRGIKIPWPAWHTHTYSYRLYNQALTPHSFYLCSTDITNSFNLHQHYLMWNVYPSTYSHFQTKTNWTLMNETALKINHCTSCTAQ